MAARLVRGARPGVPPLTVRPKALPLFLDQTRERWVIVGGGAVAERKLGTLVRSGAHIRVVSPTLTAGIGRLVRSGAVSWTKSRYRRGLLKGARFVVAATSEAAVNRSIARDARRVRAFVAVVDDPALCTVFMPAILRRGSVTIAVSTHGRSAALAAHVRDEIARRLPRGRLRTGRPRLRV